MLGLNDGTVRVLENEISMDWHHREGVDKNKGAVRDVLVFKIHEIKGVLNEVNGLDPYH